MNKVKARILHNLLRYPIILILIPLRLAALIIVSSCKILNLISRKWGDFLIKRITRNE